MFWLGGHFSAGLWLAVCHGERFSFDVVQRVQPSSFSAPGSHVLFFLPQDCENILLQYFHVKEVNGWRDIVWL